MNMSAGYELKEGKYKQGTLKDDEIWAHFAYLFSSKSHNDTSYKFGFLKSILDNLYNTDASLCLTFDQLFSKFAEIYWNLVLKYHILQKTPGKLNRMSSLERVLIESKDKFGLDEDIPYESLTSEMMLTINKKVKQKCKENVVGALYGDLGGIIYSFSKKEEYIQFNPIVYTFLCKNKTIVEKLNYYEWARFLEKVNSDSTDLLTKIDVSSKRNDLTYYRNILFEEFENRCFYCGKKLTQSNVHVDHFIPWSFIKDDNLWNFVLSCSECNLRKNDKLADVSFLETLIHRNKLISVNKYKEMKFYNADKLHNIYQFAQNNGYEQWKIKH